MIVEPGRVRLFCEGELVSEVETPGGWLAPLGPEVRIISHGPPVDLELEKGLVVRDSRGELDGIADVAVGSIPVVIRDLKTLAANVAFLDLPPPRGLQTGDVEEMYRLTSGLRVATRAAINRSAVSELGSRAVAGAGQVWLPELQRLLNLTQQLISRWPRRDSIAHRWRPAGTPGGFEEATETIRRLRDARAERLDGVVVVGRSLRRIGDSIEWDIPPVSHLARSVYARLDDFPGIRGGENLLTPLLVLSLVASPKSSGKSLPPSSWPQAVRNWFESAQRVLASVEADASADGRAPLGRMSDLYEDWIGALLVDRISSVTSISDPEIEVLEFGRFGRPTVRFTWKRGQTPIRLFLQASFRASSRDADFGLPLRSITTELIPDVVLGVGEEVVAIDAKFTSRPMLDPGVLGTTGSKYMWGLRSGSGTDFALREVVVVSNSEASTTYDERSKITSLTLNPSSTGSLDAWLLKVLGGR